MADTKISGLAAGAPAQAGDLIPIARSGANYSITPANILAYGSSPVAGTTLNAAAGTVGAPAIYLSTDTTSGLYRIGANNDGFAISGAKVLDIASTGLGVTGTGSVTTGFAVGGATPGAGGLAFPASAVAVANANTLDDYEEGTWTPSVGGTATYSGQTGIYTKIGRMVYIQCYFDILLIGTGSTTTISGLPFAAVNVQGLGICSYFANLNVNLIAPGFYASGSTLRNSGLATAADTATNDNAIFKSTTRVDFACAYMAS